MKNLLLSAIFICYGSLLSAQFSLRVGDPRVSSYTQQGSIDEAFLSVKPKGIYWEYGLYLTFSAKGTTYNSTDSLEVTLKFELPEAAIVYDSWLWIDGDISRAKILDRWTANNIYEGIVNRRRDPSILYKTGAKTYELRVFPMPGNKTRRVKITYLMPTEWSHLNTWAALPTKIAATSKLTLPNMEVLIWPDSVWQQPFMLKPTPDQPDITVKKFLHPQDGPYFRANIPNSVYNQEYMLAFKAPLKNGSFLSTYNDAGEGFYQLAILPKVSDAITNPKKIAFLFDYANTGGANTVSTVMSMAKSQMLLNLLPTDSFNVIYSNAPIKRFSNKWLPATPDNIEAAFANPTVTYFSNLGPLIADGVRFCGENGNSGKLMIFSNQADYSLNQSVIAYLDFITPLLEGLDVQMHFVDYRTLYSPYVNIGGSYYYGNAYFYFRLAQLTGGSTQTVLGSTLLKAMTEGVYNCIYEPIDYMELSTDVVGGYCFGRYLVNGIPQYYVNKPILQVGRYSGALPMSVEMTGSYDGEFFYNASEIPAANKVSADSLSREMWFGKLIQVLEAAPFSNNLAIDIVNNSLTERVLSKYTAFLCLEDSTLYCPDCKDETQITSVGQAPAADSLLEVFPNPFSDKVRIRVKTPQLLAGSNKVIIEIYQLDGRLVRQFEQAADPDGVTEVVWNGVDVAGNQAPAGVFLMTVNTGKWFSTLKLIKQ